MANKDLPKKAKPPVKPAKTSDKSKADKKKPAPRAQETDDELYDQGDIATPRRDPPYEDGL